MGIASGQVVPAEWVSFPGGELEGVRPKALCGACRIEMQRAAASADPFHPRTLCFQCYRAGLDHERALTAAGELDTASVDRFQTMLPFEPVNRARLALLKVERATSRESAKTGAGAFAVRRHHAQIKARYALQRIFSGISSRRAESADSSARAIAAATRAAELQLPEAWLPFVMSR